MATELTNTESKAPETTDVQAELKVSDPATVSHPTPDSDPDSTKPRSEDQIKMASRPLEKDSTDDVGMAEKLDKDSADAADVKSDTSDDVEMADITDSSVGDHDEAKPTDDGPNDISKDIKVEDSKEEAIDKDPKEAIGDAGVGEDEKTTPKKATPEKTKIEANGHTSPMPPSDDGLGVSKLAIDREGADSSQADILMTDATPNSSSKLVRERDDDDDDEGDAPAAKRARTAGEQPEQQQSSGPPAYPSDKPSTGVPELDELPRWLDSSLDKLGITDTTRRLYRHYLALAKKTTSGAHFRDSVTKLWPALAESYAQTIDKPMDLGEIDRKMRDGKYDTVGQMRDDLSLIYTNCVRFNGADSWLNKCAHQTLATVWGRILEVKVTEPGPKQAKAGPTRHETRIKSAPAPAAATPPPPPQPAARRQSSSAVVSPTDAPSEQAYAVPPGGVPQIRRASTLSDGTRPKRAIQTPKHKDIEYSSRPGKKSLKPELQFCEKVLNELMSAKHALYNAYFLEPVDPVFHRIPNYFAVIRKPMDLGTMSKKLSSGEYQNAKQFEADFKLVVANCVKFNGPSSPVSLAVNSLEGLFKEEMAGKAAWMAKHAPKPPAEPSSGHNSDADSDDDDDVDAVEPRKASGPAAAAASGSSQNAAIDALQAKLTEEIQKLAALIMAPTPNQAMIDVQQLVINQFTDALSKAKAKAPAESAKPPKQKAAKPVKPKPSKEVATPAKRTSTGPAKKVASSAPPKKKRKLTEEQRLKLPEGINNLPPADVNRAIELIKRDTGQAENGDGELELEMDQLSEEVQVKLWDMCKRAIPNFDAAPPSPPPNPPKAAAPPKGKPKHKPMSASEQDRKIQELLAVEARFKGGASKTAAADPVPAAGDDSDSDESSSEEE